MKKALFASVCVTLGLASYGWISPQAVAVIGAACFCLASGLVMAPGGMKETTTWSTF